MPLSAHLRTATRAAHVAVEAAFALDARLSTRDAYARLLSTLRGFYRPTEAALAALPCWADLTPSLDVASRCRAGLLDDDLARLGVDAAGAGNIRPPRLSCLAHGLGCLYVLEGSALGGRIIARRAHTALGDDLPVVFFTSAGRRDLGADWRALQAALDAFGADADARTRQATVAAANATFAGLRQLLEEVPR